MMLAILFRSFNSDFMAHLVPCHLLFPKLLKNLRNNHLIIRHVHGYKVLNRLLKSLLSAGGEKFVLKNLNSFKTINFLRSILSR